MNEGLELNILDIVIELTGSLRLGEHRQNLLAVVVVLIFPEEDHHLDASI